MARMGSYCRAYHARDLAAFSGWRPDLSARADAPLDDASVLYLHEDFRVTDGVFAGEHVVFDDAGDEWRAFCAGALGFAPPARADEVAA
jgi:hypothetical protein